MSSADGASGDARRAVMRARHAASRARQAAEQEARRNRAVRELFARPTRDYLYQVLGRPVTVLRAGGQAPLEELGLDRLRADGFEISVITVDQLAARPRGGPGEGPQNDHGPGQIRHGDLRTIPLPARSFDIVYCGFLLEHIPNAPLVLDRFLAALRPGGLLLLRIRDRDCAAAALDRLAPEPIRKALWPRLHPGEPGPFPAIYDPLASARGIQGYALSHGLVIARRELARTPPGPPGRLSAAVGAARSLVAWLSRGRLTDAHDELLYVIRKPEDRFARLVLLPAPCRRRPVASGNRRWPCPRSPFPATMSTGRRLGLQPAERVTGRRGPGWPGSSRGRPRHEHRRTASDMTWPSVWLYGRRRAYDGARADGHGLGSGAGGGPAGRPGARELVANKVRQT